VRRQGKPSSTDSTAFGLRGSATLPSPAWAALGLLLLAVTASGMAPAARAADPNGDGIPGPPALPDRNYEMVTPPDKVVTDFALPTPGLPAQGKASRSGDALYFVVEGAFADAPGSAYNNYIAERHSDRWLTRSIDAALPSVAGAFVTNLFYAFTDDLSKGLIATVDQPELAPGETPGVPDLFVRDNLAETYDLVTTEPHPDEDGLLAYPDNVWASPDLRHVTFHVHSSEGNCTDGGNGSIYVPGAPPFAAYHWSTDTGTLSVASVLPDGSFACAGTGFGGPFHWRSPGAVSDDGSRIFFTAPFGGGSRPADNSQLFVRKDHGTSSAETIHISEPEPGVVDPEGTQWAFFRAASRDGSLAFFTSCQKLTADSTAEHGGGDVEDRCNRSDLGVKNDLYLYDLEAEDLIDLTTADPSGAVVQDVIGISDDGSRVYFTAFGDLAAGFVAGRLNVYLWQRGSGIGHVAALAGSESNPGEENSPRSRPDEAQASPDGRYLAFTSAAQLTGFDNQGRVMVYRYDAEQDEIVCASCAAGGGEPMDASFNSLASADGPTPFFQLQALTEDGGRLYFDTAAALVPEDTNAKTDVYIYDVEHGRPELVSSGRSTSPSAFVTASSDGDDVFFLTRERLVGWDRDGANDIYNARVGGGFAEPEPPTPPCVGDECQGVPSPSARALVPGSALFAGRGNLRGRRACRGAAPRARRAARKLQKARKRASRLERRARRIATAEGRRRVEARAKRNKRRAARIGRDAKRVQREAMRCSRQRGTK
jgi:Tol biopolymer transport system component